MNYNDYIFENLGEIRAKSLISTLEDKPLFSLRLNLNKTNTEYFVSLFPDLKKHPHIDEAFYFDKGQQPFGKNPLHDAGMYYIQDASAMIVVKLLDIKENDLVLDLCASPGGKSTQVASYLKETGLLLANDYSYKRAQNLSENIERMGITNTVVSCETTIKIASLFEGYFDKVILDAPCSGQGMFRKNEAMYQDWTYDKTLKLALLQKELIIDAYKCLKRNGILVYSTCTFAVEENEEVIKYLLENTNASIIEIKKEKDFDESIDLKGAIRLYPDKFQGEGHFICLIQCNDNHYNNISNYNKIAHKNDVQLFKEFENKYLNTNLNGGFIKMGDELHLINKNTFSLNNLKVLRNGLHLGAIKKNRFQPNHALALSLKQEDVKNIINFNHFDNDVNAYLKGLTLTCNGKKGYNLVCVDGLSLGWVKSDGSILKNLYPRGLRKKY